MRKLASIAAAAAAVLIASTSIASAGLTSRDMSSGGAPRWSSEQQVAARGGGRNDRGGRDRDANRGRKGDPIWRLRRERDRERPFFLFRGRGDCTTRKVKVRDFNGNLVIRDRRVCN